MSERASGQTIPTGTPETPGWTRRLFMLVLVLLVCGGLRLWVIHATSVIARDGVIYTQMAQQWRSDPAQMVRESHYHPGYPAAVATLHALMGDHVFADTRGGWERAGQTVALVAGLLATVGVWALAGVAFNWRVAPIAAVLFGCGQKWVALGADVLSDSLAVCLQMAAVLLALLALRHLRRRSSRALFAAAGVGLCAGAGYLVRGEAIVAGAAACVLWLAYASTKQVRWRHALTSVVTTALVCLACMLPYMLAIGGITRKRVLGSSIVATPSTLPPIQPVIERSAGTTGIGQLFEALHPICGFLMALWLVLWIASLLTRRRRMLGTEVRPALPCLLITVTVAVISLPVLIIHYYNTGFLIHRYLMFLAALLAPTVGVAVWVLIGALVWLGRRVSVSDATRTRIAAILVVTPLLVGLIAHAARPLHSNGLPARAAGLLLREKAGPDGVVLSDCPWVRHYAENGIKLRSRRLPAEELRTILIAQNRPTVYLALTTIARNGDPAMDRLLQSAAFDLIAWPSSPKQPDGDLRLYRVEPGKLPRDDTDDDRTGADG